MDPFSEASDAGHLRAIKSPASNLGAAVFTRFDPDWELPLKDK